VAQDANFLTFSAHHFAISETKKVFLQQTLLHCVAAQSGFALSSNRRC